MKKIFRRIDKILGAIEDWSLVVVVCVALLSGLNNIILRKTTSINLYWSDEVIRKSIFFLHLCGLQCCGKTALAYPGGCSAAIDPGEQEIL
jgi:TRAP-type C4-dicarboxylate transport system permease small subunit